MVVMATCLSNPSPLPYIVALVFECIKCVLCVVHSSFFFGVRIQLLYVLSMSDCVTQAVHTNGQAFPACDPKER